MAAVKETVNSNSESRNVLSKEAASILSIDFIVYLFMVSYLQLGERVVKIPNWALEITRIHSSSGFHWAFLHLLRSRVVAHVHLAPWSREQCITL